MKALKTLLSVILVIAVASALFAEGGQEKAYPAKDIQYICNSGAGGGTDAISRKLASIIEKNMDASLPIINKPGSGEAAGPFDVMRARPDGYTIGNLTYGSTVGAVYYKLIPQYDLDKLRFVCIETQEADALMVKGRFSLEDLRRVHCRGQGCSRKTHHWNYRYRRPSFHDHHAD